MVPASKIRPLGEDETRGFRAFVLRDFPAGILHPLFKMKTLKTFLFATYSIFRSGKQFKT
jgi:hypothetical protein